jgi:4-coumarate--CoA ligase
MLGIPEIRRLILDLVAGFQERMLREGHLSRASCIGAVSAGLDVAAVDALAVDEATLGLDSLATIELVTHLNLFFGLDETGIEDYLLVRRSIGDWTELVDHHMSLVGSAARITFETSGSTGRPKRIRQTWEALDSEVGAIVADVLPGSTVNRILSAVSLTHVYGFIWGALLPRKLRVEAIGLPVGLPGAMLREARPGDLILATPFSWDRSAQSNVRFPSGVTGVTSGGPTTTDTWRAGQASGLARMIEVYGSSETGGVGWRDDPDRPFSLMSDLEAQGAPLHGLERPGAGRLAIQDHVDWVGTSAFHVRGRRDAVVQVAGTNVNLSELRALLEAEPGVVEAAVRLEGDRLKAFVARSDDAPPDIEEHLRRSLSRLPAPARPARYSFGTELPRTAAGKLADW